MPFAFGNIFYEGDYVVGIEEKPNIKHKILAGIYVFKPEIFNLIPDDEYFNMDTLIHKMLYDKIPISKYEIKEYWLDIGQVDDFQTAQDIYKQHFTGVNEL
jgi:NDP-sugar pyrophosphorylase family protein